MPKGSGGFSVPVYTKYVFSVQALPNGFISMYTINVASVSIPQHNMSANSYGC